MGQRLVIGLEAGADWHWLRQQFVTLGAEWIRDPAPEQPDVAVVTVPDDSDIGRLLDEIKQWRGVRYAERDAMHWTS